MEHCHTSGGRSGRRHQRGRAAPPAALPVTTASGPGQPMASLTAWKPCAVGWRRCPGHARPPLGTAGASARVGDARSCTARRLEWAGHRRLDRSHSERRVKPSCVRARRSITPRTESNRATRHAVRRPSPLTGDDARYRPLAHVLTGCGMDGEWTSPGAAGRPSRGACDRPGPSHIPSSLHRPPTRIRKRVRKYRVPLGPLRRTRARARRSRAFASASFSRVDEHEQCSTRSDQR
jgi:hypothetical protein